MDGAAVAGGLMPHQKDEHDVWTCKDCGWKYPNAKPSPKIRKHHKKNCPGKTSSDVHVPGGSSDDASDDEQHHSSVRGGVAPNETAADGPVDSKSRSFDFSPTPPAAVAVNGNEKEAAAHDDGSGAEPAAKETPVAVPVAAVSHDGLMPHQKDEHDIWICKECGWKYPNAKPSPKIRKNHKKHCPGKGGPGAAATGGSSDEASDDEHHHHPTPVAPAAPGETEEGSAATAATEAPASDSREIDFSALKESPNPEVVEDESTATEATPPAAVALSENAKGKEVDADDSTPAVAKKQEEAGPEVKEETPVAVPAAVSHGGLMPHQKDEHDIWICKECGWKYPNAKPSAKIRKNHKKHCPGKGGPGAAGAGGSSDEASDDEHHHHSAPVAPAAPAASEAEEGVAPNSISREIDFGALKGLPSPEVVEDETTAVETTPPAAVSLGENAKETEAHADDAAPAVAEKQEEEAGLETKEEAPAAVPVAASHGGLMPHQKDEHDIWICKECGWKYPNSKPSAKIRKHHKKNCLGKGGPGVAAAGGSSDEASDDEHHHHPAPVAPAAAATEAPQSISREIDFGALKESPSPEVVKDETTAVETTPPAAVALSENAEETEAHADDAAPAVAEKQEEEAGLETKEETPAAVPVAASQGGLMPHQKDEHDIWVCKECGWKYPNAKPSAKIRKHHKKNCPGKGGPGVAAAGGSSDEASDDEHHHHPAPVAPAAAAASGEAEEDLASTAATEAPPQSSSREIDFGALKELPSPEVVKDETTAVETTPPAAVALSENAEETEAHADDAAPAVAEKQEEEAGLETKEETPAAVPVAASQGGLMPHQKDEHDIWVCKECGWKYPNAKPSAKIRKHHKKNCPGKGGPGAAAAGGSSDEASDDEHHHHHPHPAPVPPAAGTESGEAEEGLAATAPTEAPTNISRDIDFGALKESPSPEVEKDESTALEATPPSALAIDGIAKEEAAHEDVSTPTIDEQQEDKAGLEMKEETLAAVPAAPAAASHGGLMPHQKDEHDVWVCKECGWKYPNAKPSAKIRKHHKKNCPGKGGPGAAAAGGSSDEASDDEHHGHAAPLAAAVAGSEGAEKESASTASTEAPSSISRDIDFGALKESPRPEVAKGESTAVEATPPTAAAAPDSPPNGSPEFSFSTPPAPEPAEFEKAAPRKAAGTSEPSELPPAVESGETTPLAAGTTKDAEGVTPKPLGGIGAVSLKEAIHKETEMEKEDPKMPLSLQEAIKRETEQEKQSVRKSEPTEAAAASGGLLPHQKDEADVWTCKACGWKYPNSKPSPKIRKNHKKKCPGNLSAAAVGGGGSSDGATDDEQHSTTEKATAKGAEDPTPSGKGSEALGEPGLGDAAIQSREFSFRSALLQPESEAGVPVTKKVDPTESTAPKAPVTTIGGLMLHQKDQDDIWVCKECGWKYPNAKPSPKIRKSHKKKCPGKVGTPKVNVAGSSEDASSDDEVMMASGGKCFPCFSY